MRSLRSFTRRRIRFGGWLVRIARRSQRIASEADGGSRAPRSTAFSAVRTDHVPGQVGDIAAASIARNFGFGL